MKIKFKVFNGITGEEGKCLGIDYEGIKIEGFKENIGYGTFEILIRIEKEEIYGYKEIHVKIQKSQSHDNKDRYYWREVGVKEMMILEILRQENFGDYDTMKRIMNNYFHVRG